MSKKIQNLHCICRNLKCEIYLHKVDRDNFYLVYYWFPNSQQSAGHIVRLAKYFSDSTWLSILPASLRTSPHHNHSAQHYPVYIPTFSILADTTKCDNWVAWFCKSERLRHTVIYCGKRVWSITPSPKRAETVPLSLLHPSTLLKVWHMVDRQITVEE